MKRKAPLAMMELMVMIAVFALAAALCLQAFVKSDQLSRRVEAWDGAAVLCQSVAEMIQHEKGDIVAAVEKISGEDAKQGHDNFGYFVNYDESWQVISYEEGDRLPLAYTLRATEMESGTQGLGKALVEAYAWNRGTMESLFSIEVSWQKGVTPRG